ncbi:hypothetical protein PINS_up011990 [Pythium insidiosum]|nr:hypothetical protein PINS_up011990 [Pythium insidiosum]
MVLWVLRHVVPNRIPFRAVLVSRTSVPYSARTLWPTSELVVSWSGKLLVMTRVRNATETKTPVVFHPGSFQRFDYRGSLSRLRDKLLGSFTSEEAPEHGLMALDERGPALEALVYLVNLAAITDPLVFFRLRLQEGVVIGIFESRVTKAHYLLPLALIHSDQDIPLDWNAVRFRAFIYSSELEWWELLQCA